MISKYSFYSFYLKESDQNPLEKMQVVKDGINILAFIFPTVWLLYKRMWLVALLLFIVMFLFAYLVEIGIFSETAYNIATMVLNVFFGLSAHDLYGLHLKSKGHALVGVVAAKEEMEAKLRFLEGYQLKQPVTEVANKEPPSFANPASIHHAELKW